MKHIVSRSRDSASETVRNKISKDGRTITDGGTMKETTISHEDWIAYIYSLYFGSGDPLSNCIKRAYRDFSRTLHEVGEHPNREELTRSAKKLLLEEFRNVKKIKFQNQEEFDTWHQSVCTDMQELYKHYGYDKLYIGQSQKWINMTYKYIFAYGAEQIDGYADIYQFCHVPIDNFVVNALKEKSNINPPKAITPWSRISDYQAYLNYQKLIAQTEPDVPLLDIEFYLWNLEKKRRTDIKQKKDQK